MAKSTISFDHLEWTINRRFKNQNCALNLLRLLTEYQSIWASKKNSRTAQDLISATFSLWRAAFLADKTAKRKDVLDDGTDFLRQLIEDNAISYQSDKRAREWSFNYYVGNARRALEDISLHRQEIPKWADATRTPTERWDYASEILEQGLANFRRSFEKNAIVEDQRKKKRAKNEQRKTQKKSQRAVVRQLAKTL